MDPIGYVCGLGSPRGVCKDHCGLLHLGYARPMGGDVSIEKGR